jgi:hypothetical protein
LEKGGTAMRTKIVKVKTRGSRITGNLEPEIARILPLGVNLIVLEYTDNDASAIVKLSWSEHPFAERTPTQTEIEELIAHRSVLQEVVAHPLANQLLTRMALVGQERIAESSKKPNTLIDVKTNKEVSFVRKELRKNELTYIIDEG